MNVEQMHAAAERIKKELKIKARQWLENNKDSYIIDIEGETIVDDAIIEDFLKAMDEKYFKL